MTSNPRPSSIRGALLCIAIFLLGGAVFAGFVIARRVLPRIPPTTTQAATKSSPS